jgi:hypothetical protein
MNDTSPPDGWVVWNDEPRQVVLAYRPDVFDGTDYHPACMPTLDVSLGKRDRRPGRQRVGDDWYVTLYLEPEIEVETTSHPDRESAVAAAFERAGAFASGDVDYRAAYQVPRPEYFDALDDLTGREE